MVKKMLELSGQEWIILSLFILSIIGMITAVQYSIGPSKDEAVVENEEQMIITYEEGIDIEEKTITIEVLQRNNDLVVTRTNSLNLHE